MPQIVVENSHYFQPLGSAVKPRVNLHYPIKPVATVRRVLKMWQTVMEQPKDKRRKPVEVVRLLPFTPAAPSTNTTRQTRRWFARRMPA